MIPIDISAASQLDFAARPVLMSLCVASAVVFLHLWVRVRRPLAAGPAAGTSTSASPRRVTKLNDESYFAASHALFVPAHPVLLAPATAAGRG